jgi:hypothetical protein
LNKKPLSKAIQEYEARCKDIRTNVIDSSLTISWLYTPTYTSSSTSNTRPIPLDEQLRRRSNMVKRIEYRCLYCNDFVTKLENQYPRHVFTKHQGYFPYATPDNLKSHRAGRRVISKKGKSYEEWVNTPESEIFRVMMRQEKVKWYRTKGLPIRQAAQHQRIVREKIVAVVLLTSAHYYNK